MTSRNNTRIVQQELGREHFTTVSCECVLGEKHSQNKPGGGTPRRSQLLQTPDGWSGTSEAEGPVAGETPKKPIYLQVLPRGEVYQRNRINLSTNNINHHHPPQTHTHTPKTSPVQSSHVSSSKPVRATRGLF